MRKKKTRIFGVLIILFFAINVLLFSAAKNSLGYDAENPMVLKVGIQYPPQEVRARAIKYFADLVQKRTQGRVKFEFFYSDSLIKVTQFLDGVAQGVADISLGPLSFATGKIPELSILELYRHSEPGNFLELEKAIRPLMNEILNQKNVRYLFGLYFGPITWATRTKFLKTREDWQGLKIRFPGRWFATLAVKWGASTVFLPPSDLYMALERGTIDGYLFGHLNIFALKLYEVSPYITDTGFGGNYEFVTFNLKKWNQLTAEDKKIFDSAAEEATSWCVSNSSEEIKRVIDKMTADGAKVYKLNKAEAAVYLKDSYALWDEVRKISKPLGNKLADTLETFLENSKQ